MRNCMTAVNFNHSANLMVIFFLQWINETKQLIEENRKASIGKSFVLGETYLDYLLTLKPLIIFGLTDAIRKRGIVPRGPIVPSPRRERGGERWVGEWRVEEGESKWKGERLRRNERWRKHEKEIRVLVVLVRFHLFDVCFIILFRIIVTL